MKNVLYFQYPWRLWRVRLAGVYRYAARAGWNVQMVEQGITALPIPKALRFWNPDGCIVERSVADQPGFHPSQFGSLPVVFCDADPVRLNAPIANVRHDSTETAEIAAHELFSLGLRHFAFVGNVIPREWSARRREALAAAVKRHAQGPSGAGSTFDSFEPGSPDSIASFFAHIRPWLRSLPKPCGIMAANDISGDLVLRALRMERIRVPEDVAVVGVDDDELVCTHATPTLTSVRPDFEQSGWLAAKLLDDLAAGRASVPCSVRFGAMDVARRGSTRAFKRRDDAVRAALEHIRLHACEGLGAAEVCRLIGGSRRQAETRFRAFAGRAIGAEIADVRISRAKALLLRRDLAIESLHAQCGYADPSSLRRAFKKATGLSLREFRAGLREGRAGLRRPAQDGRLRIGEE